jgi:aminoacrylate hydrolase
MPIASIDGMRIHYALTGTGAPLVLILPQSSGPAGRTALVDALARDYRVLTFDQRGTGRSDPAPASQSMASMADDLAALAQSLGIGPAHLVCHSTGCGVGLSMAAAHPSRVTGLVLTAPWTHADRHLSVMQNLRKAAARALDAEQYAHFNAALLFPPEFRRADEAGFARLAAAARSHPQDAADIGRRLDAILAFDARPLLASIRCPTLVMVARDDQLMPAWFAAEAAAGIPGARLLELDGGGHMLPQTRTVEFVEAVRGFLGAVQRAQTGAGGEVNS